MLPIRRPCTYKKLLLEYYVNNRYSDVSCTSMRSSELSELEKNVGNTKWTFSANQNYIHEELKFRFKAASLLFSPNTFVVSTSF